MGGSERKKQSEEEACSPLISSRRYQDRRPESMDRPAERHRETGGKYSDDYYGEPSRRGDETPHHQKGNCDTEREEHQRSQVIYYKDGKPRVENTRKSR